MKLRIDELASRAGTTSRNVRAYQARGLLPPPQLEGRTGYYSEEHLRRLELIGELQERGFSLEAIRHTLDAWAQGGDIAHLVGLRNVLTAPATDEQPQHYSVDDLVALFPEALAAPELIDRAVQMGLLQSHDDGGFVARSPVLIEAGAELSRAGVPLAAVYDMVAAIQPHIAGIAQHFVGLVTEHVTLPVLDDTAEPQDLQDLVETVTRLKPLAVEVVRPFLAQALQTAIERSVEEQAAGTAGSQAS